MKKRKRNKILKRFFEWDITPLKRERKDRFMRIINEKISENIKLRDRFSIKPKYDLYFNPMRINAK